MSHAPHRPNPALRAQLAATGLPEAEAIAALTAEERAADRSCGSCTVCCVTLGVPELDNPPGAPCPHLVPHPDAGGGCGIHAERPGGCRVYACAWKLGLLGDDERPDRIGGLLEWHDLDPEFHPYGGHWVFRILTNQPTRAGRDVIDHLLGWGALVLVFRGAGARLSMYYPDGSVEADVGRAPTWAAEQAGEAMGFRVAYYDSYAEGLDPDVRARIEGSEPPPTD